MCPALFGLAHRSSGGEFGTRGTTPAHPFPPADVVEFRGTRAVALDLACHLGASSPRAEDMAIM